jgi:hypothetical protein
VQQFSENTLARKGHVIIEACNCIYKPPCLFSYRSSDTCWGLDVKPNGEPNPFWTTKADDDAAISPSTHATDRQLDIASRFPFPDGNQSEEEILSFLL